jgi:hypothetical protein
MAFAKFLDRSIASKYKEEARECVYIITASIDLSLAQY